MENLLMIIGVGAIIGVIRTFIKGKIDNHKMLEREKLLKRFSSRSIQISDSLENLGVEEPRERTILSICHMLCKAKTNDIFEFEDFIGVLNNEYQFCADEVFSYLDWKYESHSKVEAAIDEKSNKRNEILEELNKTALPASIAK